MSLILLKHYDFSVDEANRRFIKLSRSDPSFKLHRDPSGKGYLQVTHLLSYVGYVRLLIHSADVVLPQRLLEYPWRPAYNQFALIDLFTKEFEMSLADQDKGLSLPSHVIDAFPVSVQWSKPRPQELTAFQIPN